MFLCRKEKFVLHLSSSQSHPQGFCKSISLLPCPSFSVSTQFGQKHWGCEESQGSHWESTAAHTPAQGEA